MQWEGENGRKKIAGRRAGTTTKWNESEREGGGSRRVKEGGEEKRGRKEKERKRRETERNAWHEKGSWFRLCSRPRSMLLPWLQGSTAVLYYWLFMSRIPPCFEARSANWNANHPNRSGDGLSSLPLARFPTIFSHRVYTLRTLLNFHPRNPNSLCRINLIFNFVFENFLPTNQANDKVSYLKTPNWIEYDVIENVEWFA